jgi:putative PIN family toxin of toxin-antitoxin system
MQRAVIDTNTWVSGLVWTGAPRRVIESVLNRGMCCSTSGELVAELRRVLTYPRIEKVLTQRGLTAADLVEQIGLVSDLVVAPALPKPICRDSDDDAVLACAVAAQADLIVSGDQDLLVLQVFEGIPILTAIQAVEWLRRAPR